MNLAPPNGVRTEEDMVTHEEQDEGARLSAARWKAHHHYYVNLWRSPVPVSTEAWAGAKAQLDAAETAEREFWTRIAERAA